MEMDQRSRGRAADRRRMNIVFDSQGRSNEDNLVFEKSAVPIVMLPVGGHEDLIKRMGLISIAWSETDHPRLSRGRDAIAESKFSQGPRIERFVDGFPRPGRAGVITVLDTHYLGIGH